MKTQKKCPGSNQKSAYESLSDSTRGPTLICRECGRSVKKTEKGVVESHNIREIKK